MFNIDSYDGPIILLAGQRWMVRWEGAFSSVEIKIVDVQQHYFSFKELRRYIQGSPVWGDPQSVDYSKVTFVEILGTKD